MGPLPLNGYLCYYPTFLSLELSYFAVPRSESLEKKKNRKNPQSSAICHVTDSNGWNVERSEVKNFPAQETMYVASVILNELTLQQNSKIEKEKYIPVVWELGQAKVSFFQQNRQKRDLFCKIEKEKYLPVVWELGQAEACRGCCDEEAVVHSQHCQHFAECFLKINCKLQIRILQKYWTPVYNQWGSLIIIQH